MITRYLRLTILIQVAAHTFYVHAQSLQPATSQTIPIDGYAAKVNDTIITRSDVRSAMAPILPQLYRRYQGAQLEQQLENTYQKTREQLIEQALIYAAFEARGGEIPDHYVQSEINRTIRNRFQGDHAKFEETLASEKITYQEYLEKTRRNISTTMLMNEEINRRARINPETIRNAYEANRHEYLIPEKIKHSIILLHHGSTPQERELKQATANRILQRLQAGEDFNTLAQEYSEGARADQGGAFPWLQLKDIDDTLHSHLNRLNVGEHSPIIENDNRFLILKVDARRNAAYKPFSEVRDTIKKELTTAERDRLYTRWIERLKKEHYIQRYD